MIFGAGAFGKAAIEEIGKDSIDYFIDNDKKKQGQIYCDKPIISLAEAKKRIENHKILVASLYYTSMISELEAIGIIDYEVYVKKIHGFFETDELIVNGYENHVEDITEDEWNKSYKIELGKKGVYDEVEQLNKNIPLFEHVEIETINRCNGVCSFCPVNCKDDPRELCEMSDELFVKIVSELEEMKYAGRVALFSNNEPMLDKKIIERNKYLREHLPNARIHLFTNGTLLTIDIFKELIEYLDELVIDNYNQQLKIIKNVEKIVEYCEQHPDLKRKVTVVLRKPVEILTTRGGNAPNRKEIVTYDKERCILPYKQFIIRPDGKVSLCCNDAIGRFTLGDVNKEKMIDIWYGAKFSKVRECLYEGRENWGQCKYCDTFFTG